MNPNKISNLINQEKQTKLGQLRNKIQLEAFKVMERKLFLSRDTQRKARKARKAEKAGKEVIRMLNSLRKMMKKCLNIWSKRIRILLFLPSFKYTDHKNCKNHKNHKSRYKRNRSAKLKWKWKSVRTK